MAALDATIPLESGTADLAEGARLGLLLVHDGRDAVRRPLPVSARVEAGRDPQCDLVLTDPCSSRAHACLSPGPDDASLWLEDHRSRNGTFVDGARVSSGGRVVVRPGQVVRLGHTLALVVDDVARASRALDTGPLRGGRHAADLAAQIAAVAPSDLPVLVQGETGTGKERVATALHEQSGRRGELVAVNCGALSAHLVESELFGHARGAFSGADRARPGLVRRAEGGTLFLDEVAELPMSAQVALLRFLEGKEVRGVGEDRTSRVDVRVISATHRDLDGMVRDERFRGDLLHRLASFRLRVPALSERKDDIVALAAEFAAREGLALAPPALERLLLASWPGNVRELQAAVRAAVVRARAAQRTEVRAADIVVAHGESASTPRATEEATTPTPAALGRAQIEAALRGQGGNVSRAARALGYTRSGFYSAMKRLDIDPAAFRG